MNTNNRIIIFDTTLRDGEQSPGCSLNINDKLKVARQLAKLGVDIIEAGFPVSSPGDFEAVKAVARQVKGPVIAGLARATKKDIDACWNAVKHAPRHRIHTFIATSDIHLKYKLKKTKEQVLKDTIDAVRYAKKYTDDVEYSAEDASRSDFSYLCSIVEAAIDAGATTINLPDTVGYAMPYEYGRMIKLVMEKVPNSGNAVFSVHCHNDLGMASANSITAIMNGARQVECAINGLGERAGNASLEEVVMSINTRAKLFGVATAVNTKEIYKTSRLVSKLTGMNVQSNKAIVGANAFAHEAGIHQDGVIKHALTYEIMTPESVGVVESKLVMGKHSGRHAFSKRLEAMGYKLSEKDLEKAFGQFKDLADKKKEIFDEDMESIVENEIVRAREKYELKYIHVTSGNQTIPTATLCLNIINGKKEKVVQEAACGDGPVDAAFKAIDRITGVKCKLEDYGLHSVSMGKDAIGEVNVRISPVGAKGGFSITGRGASTDIIEASAKAYINAINRMLARNK